MTSVINGTKYNIIDLDNISTYHLIYNISTSQSFDSILPSFSLHQRSPNVSSSHEFIRHKNTNCKYNDRHSHYDEQGHMTGGLLAIVLVWIQVKAFFAFGAYERRLAGLAVANGGWAGEACTGVVAEGPSLHTDTLTIVDSPVLLFIASVAIINIRASQTMCRATETFIFHFEISLHANAPMPDEI